MEFNSSKEWRNYCFNTHSLYLKNKHFTKWINNKAIYIFNFSNLRKEDIGHMKLGVEEAIKSARLHFKVYEENSVKRFINLKDEGMDSTRLLKIIIKKIKENHKWQACIFIFNNPIKSPNGIIRDGESLTYVSEGITIFSFDAFQKYPHNFLIRRAKHEALHLLGLNFHHEDTKVQGYNNNTLCNMQYNAPTQNLCRKCKNATLYFWKGVEHTTKQKYVRN